VQTPGTGEVLAVQDAVPFEHEADRVLVAGQKHYAAMPPDTALAGHYASALSPSRIASIETPRDRSEHRITERTP
jgi:hypothetical protein